MFRQNDQGTEETRKPSVLRRVLPFGAAFAAGFLLGKRSGPDSGTRETGGGRIEVQPAPGTPERGNATDEPAPHERNEGPSVTGTADRQAGGDDSDADPAALSAPVAHGMPMLGLGTYGMDEYDECKASVERALDVGYRHVDTAEGYENESAVGDAIAESDVPREDVFVATKLSPDNLDYDRVLTNAEESLERLGLDRVDLLYVHWPTGEYEATDTLEAFAELREEGLIGEIGVSNFTVDLLEEAIAVAEEPIFANQVEMHPLLQQEELREFCARDEVDVELVAYSPIARGDVDDVPELREVAEKHDATPVQVSLAWLRETGVTAIPKAGSREHLRENWLSLGVELDEEDVAKIEDIDREERLVDPDRAPWNE